MLAVGDDELDVETTTTCRQRLPQVWEGVGNERAYMSSVSCDLRKPGTEGNCWGLGRPGTLLG